jgi:hypothetical protein
MSENSSAPLPDTIEPKINEKRIDALKKFITLLFGTPIALSVLSKIDKDFDFGPILEKIILEHDKIITKLGLLIEKIFEIKFYVNWSTMTFYFFVFSLFFSRILYRKIFYGAYFVNFKTNPRWIYGDILTCLFFSFVLFSERMVSFLLFIYIIFAMIYFSRKLWRWWGFLSIILLLYNLAKHYEFFVYLLVYPLYVMEQDPIFLLNFLFFLISIFSIRFLSKLGDHSISYVFLWMIGIWLTDFISNQIVPAIQKFIA